MHFFKITISHEVFVQSLSTNTFWNSYRLRITIKKKIRENVIFPAFRDVFRKMLGGGAKRHISRTVSHSRKLNMPIVVSRRFLWKRLILWISETHTMFFSKKVGKIVKIIFHIFDHNESHVNRSPLGLRTPNSLCI